MHILVIVVEVVVLLMMLGMQVIFVVRYVHMIIVVSVLECLEFLLVNLVIRKSCRGVLKNWGLRWCDDRRSTGRGHRFSRRPNDVALHFIQQQVFCLLLTQHVVDADDAVRSGRTRVVDNGSVALNPRPSTVFGHESIVLCRHLSFIHH